MKSNEGLVKPKLECFNVVIRQDECRKYPCIIKMIHHWGT